MAEKTIALAGNPNVGKSTLFNALTGLKQHTGNWPGKTVGGAEGYCEYEGEIYRIVDLPGCYSLLAHSKEEEAARDYICFEHPDAVLVVCDATCLERNLNLALQVIEASKKVILCVNMMDEAEKKRIYIDQKLLSKELKVPVIGMTAGKEEGLEQIFPTLRKIENSRQEYPSVTYPHVLEKAVECVEPAVRWVTGDKENTRWLSIRLLEDDKGMRQAAERYFGYPLEQSKEVAEALLDAREIMEEQGYSYEGIKDMTVSAYISRAEEIAGKAMSYENQDYRKRDRMLDKIFTGKRTGFPVMFLLLLLVFFITITGANIPSHYLSVFFTRLEEELLAGAQRAGIPPGLYEPVLFGIYRVTTWVTAVMLPPMAIFFPLFTLLEDFGYLPRVAYNLDRCFQRCHACGKQALSMCMGFGCNAVGVTGCRIIDSPRERLLAVITNSFVPCNGRFPMILMLISLFLVGDRESPFASILSAALLAGVIVFGIAMTFLVSGLLSKTILKGVPSSFVLELPPYRKPQFGKVIVRSVLDRTIFVLGRAVLAAAPAGLLIWVLANVTIGGDCLLNIMAGALDPFSELMGMDGVILLAYILGFPANEIVIPIAAMIYLSQGTLTDIGDMAVMWEILTSHGWTAATAVSVILFSLMHWPCATTCQTIYKETGSIKWTILAVTVPTAAGILICMLATMVMRCIL